MASDPAKADTYPLESFLALTTQVQGGYAVPRMHISTVKGRDDLSFGTVVRLTLYKGGDGGVGGMATGSEDDNITTRHAGCGGRGGRIVINYDGQSSMSIDDVAGRKHASAVRFRNLMKFQVETEVKVVVGPVLETVTMAAKWLLEGTKRSVLHPTMSWVEGVDIAEGS
jgi:hypothetical protein